MKSNEKSVVSIRRQCFSCAEFSFFFRAVNSIYLLNDFTGRYVCCCWMCLHAGDCFLFEQLNVEVFGVSDSPP